MVPREAVDLIETVIVVGSGVVFFQKCRGVYRGHGVVALREEVIAIVGIEVARAPCCRVAAPAHGSFGVEEMLAANDALLHLGQVVEGLERVAVEDLVLQVTAIAVDLHLVDVGEASLAYEAAAELIDARCRHAYLHPPAGGQDGMRGIAVGVERRMMYVGFCHLSCRSSDGLRVYAQHEAGQDLVSAIAVDERAERQLQVGTAAVHHHLLLDGGQRGQRFTAQPVISLDVALRHIHKLGVEDGGCVHRVGIVLRQRDGIGKLWQRAVDAHLLVGQVEEALGGEREGEEEEEKKEKERPSPPPNPPPGGRERAAG